MLTPDQTLDMTPIGMVFHITKTAHETNGQSLEMAWTLLPKAAGTPVHIHPAATETYRVLEGQLEVNINGKWQFLQPGEEISVPPNTPHTFRNPIDRITKVYNTHSPAMQFDNYFEGLSNIVAKIAKGSHDKMKLDLNTIIHLSMLMKKYPREIISVNPPNFIVSLMSFIGKLKGIKV